MVTDDVATSDATGASASSTAYGIASVLGLASSRVLAAAGWDLVLLDCQHGGGDEADAASDLRGLAGAVATLAVRVSTLDATLIGRVADAGADVVVVPTVESAEQAAAAVRAVRFPPVGVRSFGPTRADVGPDPRAIEQRVALIVMIESRAGLDALERIVQVEGIAGVLVGPIDLGIALGVDPGVAATSDEVTAATERIAARCRAAGVSVGSFAVSRAHAARLATIGLDLIIVGSDARALRDDASGLLAELRGDDVGTTAVYA